MIKNSKGGDTMKRNLFCLVVISGMFLYLFATIGFGAQGIISVKPGESIQAAIDTAAPGTTIELGPGTWTENVEIVKPIALRGAGADKTTIKARLSGYPVIWLTSTQTDSVSISGVTVSGAFGDTCAEKANKVCADGVLVQGAINLKLSNCNITHNALHGLYANGAGKLTIEQTTFSHNYSGIWLSGSASARVDNSVIVDNKFGLVLAEKSSARVIGSSIANNDADGVLVADATDLTLSNNRITGNGRAGVCVDEWPCYRTRRTFTGTIHGEKNVIPTPRQANGNKRAAICPVALRFLRLDSGGIYPIPNPESLFQSLPISPPLEGDPHAPVTMIEFSDLTCPYCARFALDVLPEIERDYIDTGKAKLYFLPYPVHGDVARKEAEAVFCAQEQGIFWPFQERMFTDLRLRGFPETFDMARVRAITASAGGDPDRMEQCLTAGTYAHAVQESIAIADKLGVAGTPTLFIDGMEVFGVATYDVYKSIIDSELLLKKQGL